MGRLVARDLELVRERKVVEAVDPRQLLDDVGPEQVEAAGWAGQGGRARESVRCAPTSDRTPGADGYQRHDAPEEQRRGKALLGANVDKVREDLLGDLLLARLGRRQDSVLEQFVALAERDRVVPLLVLVVEQDGEPAELEQLVLLEPARERERVKIGELRRAGRRQSCAGPGRRRARRCEARTLRMLSRRVGTCSSSMRSSLYASLTSAMSSCVTRWRAQGQPRVHGEAGEMRRTC